jgi:glycosyltransferase involved in cell wall biosynthesis
MLDVISFCVERDNNFKLVIIGDGSEREKIEAICQEKNLREHVLLVGQQEDVLPYLRVLDVFLLTSFREQMPMAVLEAMSVGKPVISSRVGEVPTLSRMEKKALFGS